MISRILQRKKFFCPPLTILTLLFLTLLIFTLGCSLSSNITNAKSATKFKKDFFVDESLEQVNVIITTLTNFSEYPKGNIVVDYNLISLNLSPKLNDVPGLSAALDSYNNSTLKMQPITQEKLKELIYYSHDVPTVEHSEMLSIRRADTKVFSFIKNVQGFYLDDYPHTIMGKNFASQTGTELALYDVITDIEALARIITAKLVVDYPHASFNQPRAVDKNYLYAIVLDYLLRGSPEWVLEPHGISVLFNAGVILMDESCYYITIPFSEVSTIFNSAYRVTPSNYAIEIINDTPHYALLEDGRLLKLTLSYNPDYDYKVITLGDERLGLSGWSVGKVYLISLADGRRYLYVIGYNSDYSEHIYQMLVLDITDGKITPKGQVPDLSTTLVDYDLIKTYPITNPHYFTLIQNSFDCSGITAIYKIGADGMPVLIEK